MPRIGVSREYHGMKHTPEYAIWSALKNRCLNPNDPRWDSYGGRGITLSEEWQHSFRAFIQDMGSRPTSDHSIERINNDKPYSATNCRWGTRLEQARNKRNNRLLTFKGKTQCVSAWAQDLGIPNKTILSRLCAGWSVENTLSRPIRRPRPQQASVSGV
jgi:hypothetical protein